MAKLKDIHRVPGNPPLAYFITMRTYGTFLHGDVRGAVDKAHCDYLGPRVEENALKEEMERARMDGNAFLLCAESAGLMERVVVEVCGRRGWHVFAVAARTTHVHVVVGARLHTAERVMGDLKAWGTRRLREGGFVAEGGKVWAHHGSTPHLFTEGELIGAVDYVLDGQGPPLRGGERKEKEKEKEKE